MKTSSCDGEDMFQKHTITSLPPELRMPSQSTGKSQPRDPMNELMQLSLPRGGDICICYKMLALLQALYTRTAARKVKLMYMHYTEANFHLVSQLQTSVFKEKMNRRQISHPVPGHKWISNWQRLGQGLCKGIWPTLAQSQLKPKGTRTDSHWQDHDPNREKLATRKARVFFTLVTLNHSRSPHSS